MIRRSLIPALALALSVLAPASRARAGETDIFGQVPAAAPSPTGSPAPDGPNWAVSAGRGKPIAVFDPVGVGVDPEGCMAVGDLLRTELVKQGRAVTPRVSMKVPACADEVCAAAEGRKLLVPEALVTRLSRLGQKVIVISTLVDTGSGAVVWSDRVSTETLDDMDVLSGRIARAANERVTVASTMTPDTVTGNEGREQRRQKSVVTVGVRIGGALPVADAYGSAPPMYDIELVSYYEVRRYLIEASVGFLGNTNDPNHAVTVGILPDLGGYYQLTNADITPFLGGGVGLHAIGVSSLAYADKTNPNPQPVYRGGGAPALWVGGGLNMLRAADVHVLAVAKYSVDFIGLGQQQVQSNVFAGVAITYARRGSGGCCLW